MIERDGDNIVWCCDGCSETIITETDDFELALGMLRREHWRAAKEDDVWVHLCPDCIRKGRG